VLRGDVSLSKRALVFVGSYNMSVPHAPSAHGEGIQVIEVDFDAGRATLRMVYRDVANPSYVWFDEGRRVLYAISEIWGGAEGAVSALSFDANYARVVEHTKLSSGGTVPAYISVFRSTYLLLANYGDGSLAAFSLRPDGHFGQLVSLVQLSGSGPDPERQKGPHAHCILGHPSNGFVYATDLGSDKVYQVAVDSATGQLVICGETSVTGGSGPRHMVFDPSGNWVFLVHELSSRLGIFRVESTGTLVQQQYLPLLPPDYKGSSFGADLAVSSDGRHVYATNRGHDSIACYSVDSATGALSVVGWQGTGGKTPRSVALDPSGGYLLVANQDSDTIQVFQVAKESGELKEAFSIAVPTPVCVKCAPVEP
jgi:6-phosphogluconolactonase